MAKHAHVSPLFSDNIGSSKRSEFETLIDILEEIKSGNDVPTRIMGHVNISWNPMKSILRKLKAKDLIHEYSEVTVKKDKARRRYRVTEKTDVLLYHIHKVRELLEV